MASLKNTTINDTGFIQTASGTTAERPSPTNGMTRYNSTTGCLEIYNSATATWNCLSDNSYNVELLLVGGGGSGGASAGANGGGGGGGGGVVYISSFTISGSTSYSLVVGAGSPGVQNYQFGTGTRNLSPFGSMLSRGGDTTGFGYTAFGGGNGCGAGSNAATQGGSGGGSRRDYRFGAATSITTGQGNSGGNADRDSCGSAGGGGGAGAAGSSGCGDCTNAVPFSSCSKGGDGVLYNWLGDLTYYGAGGGGSFASFYYFDSNIQSLPPLGGRTGGGRGALSWVDNFARSVAPAENGIQNTGGGGGGGIYVYSGGAGGSGIIMIRYPGPPIGTGGDVIQNGGFTVHVFRGSGTFIG